jgi:hypothetical protein
MFSDITGKKDSFELLEKNVCSGWPASWNEESAVGGGFVLF